MKGTFAAKVSEVRSSRWGLGWHWLWFLPVCVLVLGVIERHTIVLALAVLKLAWVRWKWAALISPSAAFCSGVLFCSVTWPIFGLAFVAALVSERKPWPYSLGIIVAIVLLPFVTDTLIWGSFPFVFDDQGVGRLRMIPFIPWPAGHFGEL
jgi:hypothetical protein